jgi:hypothetical protein
VRQTSPWYHLIIVVSMSSPVLARHLFVLAANVELVLELSGQARHLAGLLIVLGRGSWRRVRWRVAGLGVVVRSLCWVAWCNVSSVNDSICQYSRTLDGALIRMLDGLSVVASHLGMRILDRGVVNRVLRTCGSAFVEDILDRAADRWLRV